MAVLIKVEKGAVGSDTEAILSEGRVAEFFGEGDGIVLYTEKMKLFDDSFGG